MSIRFRATGEPLPPWAIDGAAKGWNLLIDLPKTVSEADAETNADLFTRMQIIAASGVDAWFCGACREVYIGEACPKCGGPNERAG